MTGLRVGCGETVKAGRSGDFRMSRRRVCVALLATMSGCGRRSSNKELLPAAVGNWKRVSLREVPASEAPDVVPRAGLRRVQSAEYEGTGRIEAQVYEMTSSALGLDLQQRWHPAADTVFFYRDNYFAVIKWNQFNRDAVQDFVRGLEKHLAS
jgi:hypothetical protein